MDNRILGPMTTSPNALGEDQQRFLAAVRGLKAARMASTAEMCEVLHVSRATWFNRLADCGFDVTQIRAMARFFGVTEQQLFDGMGHDRNLPGQEVKLAYLPPSLASVCVEPESSTLEPALLRLVG